MNEVLPVANKLDPVEGEIPMELRNKMGELGYFGIMIPEEYGGLGLGSFEYALVAEELARAWMSVGSIIARGNGIYGDASEEQKRKYYPAMARGEFLGAFSLSEPDAGPTSPTSPAGRRATAMNSSSTAPRPGAPLPMAPTLSICSRGPRRRRRSGATSVSRSS